MEEREKFIEKLDKMVSRVQEIVDLYNLDNKYLKLKQDKNNIIFLEHNDYFKKINFCVQSCYILSICNLFDKGNDCLNIYELKNYAIREFDKIFTEKFAVKHVIIFDDSKQDINKNGYSSKQEMNEMCKRLLNNCEDSLELLKKIRNNGGLAHGIETPEKVNVEKKEVKNVIDRTCMILNIFISGLFDKHCNFFENSKIYIDSLENITNNYKNNVSK